jgi:hypothetical protein
MANEFKQAIQKRLVNVILTVEREHQTSRSDVILEAFCLLTKLVSCVLSRSEVDQVVSDIYNKRKVGG